MSPPSFCRCIDAARSVYSTVDARRPRLFGGGTACLEHYASRRQKCDVINGGDTLVISSAPIDQNYS